MKHKIYTPLIVFGFSMIELVVALGVITLVISIGFAAFTMIESRTGTIQKILNQNEVTNAAFNIFYDYYNSAPSNVALIEQLNNTPRIRFSNGTSISYIANATSNEFTINGVNSSLDVSELFYKTFTLNSESCRFGSGSNYEFEILCSSSSLRDGYNSNLNELFNRNNLKELYISMLNGRLCKVSGYNNSTNKWIMAKSGSELNCPGATLSLSTSSTTSNTTAYFTTPRIVVFKKDKSYARTILESFVSPVDRYGNTTSSRTPSTY